MRLFLLSALAASAAVLAPSAHAAESFDACHGFIRTLPAVVDAQGVWCLDGDVATSIASGAAIVVATNNVTIDCNGYKIGGLGAGTGTNATGIYANGRMNVAVRGCHLRGFRYGVRVAGTTTSGHLVTGNRIEASTTTGVWLDGSAVRVTDNDIIDTGAGTGPKYSAGIKLSHGQGVVDRNRIGSVVSTASGDTLAGITLEDVDDTLVEGNSISALGPEGTPYGIDVYLSDRVIVVGNRVMGAPTGGGGAAVYSTNATTLCVGNLVADYPALLSGCVDGGGNQMISTP